MPCETSKLTVSSPTFQGQGVVRFEVRSLVILLAVSVTSETPGCVGGFTVIILDDSGTPKQLKLSGPPKRDRGNFFSP